MTVPLSDQRLDHLAERAGFCRAGCEASSATGELVAEIRRLRGENEQLVDFDDADRRRAALQTDRDRAVQRWHEEHKRAQTLEAERNRLARALADRGDEYDTLRAEFDAFADTCASHSADRCVEQVAAEDLQAAYDRLGEQAQRIVDAATRFRAERDRLHDALGEVLAEPWDLDDPELAGRLERWRGVFAATERSERGGDQSAPEPAEAGDRFNAERTRQLQRRAETEYRGEPQ